MGQPILSYFILIYFIYLIQIRRCQVVFHKDTVLHHALFSNKFGVTIDYAVVSYSSPMIVHSSERISGFVISRQLYFYLKRFLIKRLLRQNVRMKSDSIMILCFLPYHHTPLGMMSHWFEQELGFQRP